MKNKFINKADILQALTYQLKNGYWKDELYKKIDAALRYKEMSSKFRGQ